MDRLKRELWRLRLNWLLLVLLASLLYSVSNIGFLSSFHRFVTNPKIEHLNETQLHKSKLSQVEPGLGESELFYSLILTSLYVGAVIGGLLSGFLVRCVPYWYQCVVAISSHILGYTLYGVASQGWMLMISQLLVGYYFGAEITLSFSYANESSSRYAEVVEERGGKPDAIKIRNYLFALISVGWSAGLVIGPGIAVLFTHLPIEQYRSIAWFNVACGVILLILFIVFFRGESSCKRMLRQCSKSQICLKPQQGSKPRVTEVFILVTMFILSLVDMVRWGFFETLLNPVLSDSFGLSLAVSSYIYLGLSIPCVLGSLLLFTLEKIKVSSQVILLIGILIVMSGYVLVADWQAIPYDPCTEYSPFHHPDILKNQSVLYQPLNHSLARPEIILRDSNFVDLSLSNRVNLQLHSRIELNFNSGTTVNVQLPFHLDYSCQAVTQCAVCDQSNWSSGICLTYVSQKGKTSAAGYITTSPQLFLCSIDSTQLSALCLRVYSEEKFHDRNSKVDSKLVFAHEQNLLILNSSAYSFASNACMNADVPDRECHWIPFSTITKKNCSDCPPICRSKVQTLNFVQFLIGMILLMFSNALIWMPLMAVSANQTSEEFQGIVIGLITTMNYVAQAVSPIIFDAAYEGMQKRTFFITILLASIHIPYIVEIVVLYKQLGPPTGHYSKKNDGQDYHVLKSNN